MATAITSESSDVEFMSDNGASIGNLNYLSIKLRYYFSRVIGLLVSLLYLQRSVDEFRLAKIKKVESGTKTIQTIQSVARNSLLDTSLQFVTLAHDSDFYLIALPLLFWNVDFCLAYRMTFLVVSGTFLANFLKDLFQLPRPQASQVWRPEHAQKLDSASLLDYGFPSSHATNALTNTFTLYLYYHEKFALGPFTACVAWIIIVCFSRLYLGAHTLTDIRGGLLLGVGLLYACHAKLFVVGSAGKEQTVDVLRFDWFAASVNSFIYLLCSSFVILFLTPIPSNVETTTFFINCELLGLFGGLLMGSSAHNPTSCQVSDASYLFLFAKTIAGFVSLLCIRVVMKTALQTVEQNVFSIKLGEKINKKRRKTHLFSKDLQILLVGFNKLLIYYAIAYFITTFSPPNFIT